MHGFGMYFSMSHRDQVLTRIFELPGNQRPQFYHLEERPKRKDLTRVHGTKDLKKIIKNSVNSSFILSSKCVSIDINKSNPHLFIRGETGSTWDIILPIMEHMMKAKPIFGFGSYYDEYAARNQLVTETTMGTLHAFLGRNIEKFIPGLYWITILSDRLIKNHKLDINPISTAALSHIHKSESHLFQFYQNPEDWKEQEKKLKLLSKSDVFFHKEHVIDSIGSETDWRVIDEKLLGWE